MDTTVLVAIISNIAGIIEAIIGKIPISWFEGIKFRRGYRIYDITKTTWDADWYFEDGSLYVSDHVTFEKWIGRNQFSGFGKVRYNDTLYTYSIKGEISPKGIVVLTYKAQRYPTEAPIGMACLQLSDNAENLEGYWSGLAQHEIKYGAVKMHKFRT